MNDSILLIDCSSPLLRADVFPAIGIVHAMCVRGGGEGRWGGCKALVPGYFDKLPGYARERLNVLDGTPWQLPVGQHVLLPPLRRCCPGGMLHKFEPRCNGCRLAEGQLADASRSTIEPLPLDSRRVVDASAAGHRVDAVCRSPRAEGDECETRYGCGRNATTLPRQPATHRRTS